MENVPASIPTNTWLPLLTGLGGYLLSLLTEYFRDKRTSERERTAREAARRLHLFERRSDFQRQTLLSLQESVVQHASAAGSIYRFEAMEFKKTNRWGGQLLPKELDDSEHEAGVKTLMFMVRVRDPDIRELTRTFRTHANQVGFCKSESESRAELMEMGAALEPLHERIGMILRKLDDDEVETEKS